jgi:sialic acid synthase SpsE
MIDELRAVDSGKHSIVLKWQLFERAGENKPLDHSVFRMAYYYAEKHGYKTTASVFDLSSLRYLLKFNIPFVKIANNRSLDWLIGEVPRKIPVFVSCKNVKVELEMRYLGLGRLITFACVSNYPAKIEDYIESFDNGRYYSLTNHPNAMNNISDHTIGLELYKKYEPDIWEKHYKLSDSTGLDAGEFAITPEELKEIL